MGRNHFYTPSRKAIHDHALMGGAPIRTLVAQILRRVRNYYPQATKHDPFLTTMWAAQDARHVAKEMERNGYHGDCQNYHRAENYLRCMISEEDS